MVLVINFVKCSYKMRRLQNYRQTKNKLSLLGAYSTTPGIITRQIFQLVVELRPESGRYSLLTRMLQFAQIPVMGLLRG